MIAIGIILIIIGIIAFCYSIKYDNLFGFALFVVFIGLVFFGACCIFDGINNSKYKEREIKNVEYYKIKSTIILEDNIPIDTIYTIYYKKK